MGCSNSSQSVSIQDAEKKFVPFGGKKNVKTKADISTSQKDFVVEYPSVAAFSQNYSMHHKLLGSGAFGQVRKATKKSNGEIRAVKMIDKLQLDEQERVRLKYEIEILKNLVHPNIVRLYEVYENKSAIYLVTELCDGCELFDEISKRDHFTENEAAHVTKQILQSIAYCHGKNVAHRDLKPENILIDIKNRGTIKVIDFGTSHHYEESSNQMHQMYGTPYYIAPEVLQGKYDEKCDIWSIGVMLYIMLCGRPPFNGNTEDQIIAKVKRAVWEFRGDIWDSISPEAKDLISKLMNKNVSQRLSAVDALTHPWIKSRVKTTFNEGVAKKAISQLTSFQNESKLKQATLTFMAGHLATKAQQQELRKSFNQFDENGDGLIQRQEFLNGYRRLHPNQDATTIDERAGMIFDNADTDGSGAIDFGEWCTATINQNQLLNEENMRAAFALFDKDGGGTIEAAEIAAILGHDVNTEDRVWQEVIQEVDTNNDGQIDFEEFQQMFLRLAERREDTGTQQ